MGENSNIEWTTHTFNPWIGCTKVSPGCAHCYAETQDKHRKWTPQGWGKGAPRKRTSESNWRKPLKWNADAARLALDKPQWPLRPQPRVFCASLADWLDDEVPIEWLADLLKLIHDTPNLDWLLLTKRPENWEPRLYAVLKKITDGTGNNGPSWQMLVNWISGLPPAHVSIGTSIEDQKRANERIPKLLYIPAHSRFLSVEPQLEYISLKGPFDGPQAFPVGMGINWVIVGGESGPKRRPFNEDWARDLRDHCRDHNCAFFMKQIDKVREIPSDLMIREFPA